MINLIACVINHKNKMVIGSNGGLVVKLNEDLCFFKNITTNSLSTDSKLDFNVVIMGKKTYFSIEEKYRPLKCRLNLVLTNEPKLQSKLPESKFDLNKTYFINLKTFRKFYKKYNPNVFVIGGGEIYNLFLNSKEFKPEKVYLTQVKNYGGEIVNPTTMNHLDESYKLIGYSNKMYGEKNISFRILHYRKVSEVSEEHKYLNLAKFILENGKEQIDRTGVGTISIFGTQLRFDISNGNLPLMTTKQVPLKAIVEELLFFCRGDTNTKILEKKGVKIWSGNTSREFLDKRGLGDYPEGCMGPMYPWSWRYFGAKYSPAFSDTSKCDRSLIGGVDQLNNVLHLLKTDPFSRRIYISNLNPAESSKMCLEPCHTYIQFYVEEINGVKYLSGYFTMRSNDIGCGFAFNLISYVLLINILALKCGMKPKEIVYSCANCHIYNTHFEQIKKQLTRTPRPFPHIKLDESLKNKDWSEMEYSDFELIGYFAHTSIKMPMAI